MLFLFIAFPILYCVQRRNISKHYKKVVDDLEDYQERPVRRHYLDPENASLISV